MLDFGLAKVVGKGAKMDVTVAGSLLGTPRYMAPEQVRGEELGQAADIYSFGLVMAEMLLGRPLVDGRTEMDIFATQGSDVPLTIPAEVQASPFGPIIERAVSKPVAVRYHLASQMLADLRAAMAHIGACPEDGPRGAELEATAILDMSKLPVGLAGTSNPTAEKLRRVFNTLALKAADAKAAVELEQAAARMPQAMPVIEDEQTDNEYPESWTGPRPDREDFEFGPARSPNIGLDLSRNSGGAHGATAPTTGRSPAERPFAAVGVVPGAGSGFPPSSRPRPSAPALRLPASATRGGSRSPSRTSAH